MQAEISMQHIRFIAIEQRASKRGLNVTHSFDLELVLGGELASRVLLPGRALTVGNAGSTDVISWAPNPVAVRVCLGRVMP